VVADIPQVRAVVCSSQYIPHRVWHASGISDVAADAIRVGSSGRVSGREPRMPFPRLMLWYVAHSTSSLYELRRSRRCGVVFAAEARATENRRTTSRTVKRDGRIDETYRFAVR